MWHEMQRTYAPTSITINVCCRSTTLKAISTNTTRVSCTDVWLTVITSNMCLAGSNKDIFQTCCLCCTKIFCTIRSRNCFVWLHFSVIVEQHTHSSLSLSSSSSSSSFHSIIHLLMSSRWAGEEYEQRLQERPEMLEDVLEYSALPFMGELGAFEPTDSASRSEYVAQNGKEHLFNASSTLIGNHRWALFPIPNLLYFFELILFSSSLIADFCWAANKKSCWKKFWSAKTKTTICRTYGALTDCFNVFQ